MKESVNPKAVKRIIEIIIAILAAIAGGITEAATGFIGGII